MEAIKIGKHFEEFIETQVESGRYSSEEDVVNAALRLLEVHEASFMRLEKELLDGINSGIEENFNLEDFKQELNNSRI